MLKKLSLIFICFAPFLLALNILFKILLRYYTISTVIISCVDLVTVMVVLIGLILYIINNTMATVLINCLILLFLFIWFVVIVLCTILYFKSRNESLF